MAAYYRDAVFCQLPLVFMFNIPPLGRNIEFLPAVRNHLVSRTLGRSFAVNLGLVQLRLFSGNSREVRPLPARGCLKGMIGEDALVAGEPPVAEHLQPVRVRFAGQ